MIELTLHRVLEFGLSHWNRLNWTILSETLRTTKLRRSKLVNSVRLLHHWSRLHTWMLWHHSRLNWLWHTSLHHWRWGKHWWLHWLPWIHHHRLSHLHIWIGCYDERNRGNIKCDRFVNLRSPIRRWNIWFKFWSLESNSDRNSGIWIGLTPTLTSIRLNTDADLVLGSD